MLWERRGIVTTRGLNNYASEHLFRLHRSVGTLARSASREVRFVDKMVPGLDMITERVASGPTVAAADQLVDAVHSLVDSGERFREARGDLDIAGWRQLDLPRRARLIAKDGTAENDIKREAKALVRDLDNGLTVARSEALSIIHRTSA